MWYLGCPFGTRLVPLLERILCISLTMQPSPTLFSACVPNCHTTIYMMYGNELMLFANSFHSSIHLLNDTAIARVFSTTWTSLLFTQLFNPPLASCLLLPVSSSNLSNEFSIRPMCPRSVPSALLVSMASQRVCISFKNSVLIVRVSINIATTRRTRRRLSRRPTSNLPTNRLLFFLP